MIVQFLTIEPQRGKILDGQFYTFLNFTRSLARGVENFIHSKILQGDQLRGGIFHTFKKSYKVIIGFVGFQMSGSEIWDSDPGPWIRPLA